MKISNSMHVRKIATIIGLVVVIAHQTFAQDFSGNSIKLGIGYESLDENKFTGNGPIAVVGYQWKLNDWLYLAPQLKHGTFYTINTKALSKQYFNTISTGVGVNATFLKVLYAGLGCEFTYMHGLIGPYLGQDPKYEKDLCFDFYATAGFCIAPKDKQFAVNILPFSFSCGTNNYFNGGIRVEMEIKLKECKRLPVSW